MYKNLKWKLVLSSLIILLPAILGAFFWEQIPSLIPSHISLDGAVDSYSSKAAVLFGMPVMLLALHYLCLFVTARASKNQSEKVGNLTLFLIPGVSLLTYSLLLLAATQQMDLYLNVTMSALAVMFLVIGNYLPKCRQNWAMGIKLPWTLGSEANWNATHRFGGKLWVAGGVAMLLLQFLPEKIAVGAMFVLIFLMVLIPTVYSYLFYRKNKDTENPPAVSANLKKGTRVSLVFVVVLLTFVVFLMFTGEITMECGDNGLEIQASYYGDLTLSYDAISRVEYRQDVEAGMRVGGFGSPRLSMGWFRNDQFGRYLRYAYTGADACVVVTYGSENSILVIAASSDEETKSVYEDLLNRIP